MGYTCNNCEKRHPCCHATCEKYLREKAAINKIKEKRAHEQKLRDDIYWASLNSRFKHLY